MIFVEVADVFVVDIHVDEAAQLAFVVEQVAAQVGVLGGQLVERFAHGGGIDFDGIVATGVLAQRGGNENLSHYFSPYSISSFAADVWSGSGSQLLAWSNVPF